MSAQESNNQLQLRSTKFDYGAIENPFDGDLLGRKVLAEQLLRYVDRLQIGAVIAIDARWGEGKTWFAQHWKMMLENTDHEVIYLNAFANDYVEDPFLIIASEIAGAFEKKHKDNARTIRQMAASAYQSLLPLLPQLIIGLGMTAVGAGYFSQIAKNGYESVKDVADDISEGMSEKIKEAIECKIEDYETEKESLESFKLVLRQFAEKLDQPLVFIIDELDRCRPEFSIRLLERIKHFFDIPNVVFVLIVDKPRFVKAVNHVYGFNEEIGDSYFEKFIDFTIKLQSIEKDNQEKYSIALKTLLISLGLVDEESASNSQFYADCLIYCRNCKPTLRFLKRVLSRFALLKFDRNELNSFLLAFLFYEKHLKNEVDIISVNYLINLYRKYVKELYPKNDENMRKIKLNSFSMGQRITDDTYTQYALTRHFQLNENSFNQFLKIQNYFENKTSQSSSHDDFPLRKSLQPPSQQDESDFYQAWKNYISQGT